MKSSIRDDALFIDTWGWLALADAKDPAHSRAVAERRMRATGRLVTTDYVLDETFTRLFARCGFSVARQFSSAVLEAASKRQLVLERITPPRFDAAYQMRFRYRDKTRNLIYGCHKFRNHAGDRNQRRPDSGR